MKKENAPPRANRQGGSVEQQVRPEIALLALPHKKLAAWCPYCGQTIHNIRLGVHFPPLKAAIVDRIKAAGDIGVSSVEIITDLYHDRRAVAPSTIKAHANQINDLLASTDWRLRSDGRRWYLRQEAP
jgi:hypothetical protein